MTTIELTLSDQDREQLTAQIVEKVAAIFDRKLAKLQLGNPPEDPRYWRSRAEVAKLFGVSSKTIQRWEVRYGLKQDPKVGGNSAAYSLEEIAKLERALAEAKEPQDIRMH